LDGPFIVLLKQDGVDQTIDSLFITKSLFECNRAPSSAS
jgi:hypothetical protein